MESVWMNELETALNVIKIIESSSSIEIYSLVNRTEKYKDKNFDEKKRTVFNIEMALALGSKSKYEIQLEEETIIVVRENSYMQVPESYTIARLNNDISILIADNKPMKVIKTAYSGKRLLITAYEEVGFSNLTAPQVKPEGKGK